MSYEDRLREAFESRAQQLEQRRPRIVVATTTDRNEDAAITPWWRTRRWQSGALAAAVAAAALGFVIVAVANRSVDRVTTGPDLAAHPTSPPGTPWTDEETTTERPIQAVAPLALTAGPATIVGPDGAVLFVVGGDLPHRIEPSIAVQIEAELLSMAALGEQLAERRDAISKAGLTVRVALDLDAQQRAAAAFASLPPELDAVAVTVDPSSGDIVSAVSRSGSSLELAQPAGSARIITYAAAMELGLTPLSLIDGSGPCEIESDAGSVTVDNFGSSPGGLILLRHQATRSSRCAEARLEVLSGPRTVSQLLASMTGADLDGLIVDAPPLTAIEHVGPVVAAANQGELPSIGFIVEVTTPEGSVLFRRPDATRVMSPTTADALTDLMASAVERGTGTAAQVDDTLVVGLTGTDTEFRAAWFVGSASGLSTAVWVAQPTGEPMLAIGGRNVTGGSYPAEVWAIIHEGFRTVRGSDELRPLPPEPLCPIGYPVEIDADDDGITDQCVRSARDNRLIDTTPPTPIVESSCPSSHPLLEDIDGDQVNDGCVVPGFLFSAPAADYATSINVKMQIGQTAMDRYLAAGGGSPDFSADTLIFVGTAVSGTEAADLFRWHSANGADPAAFGRCVGTVYQTGGTGVCDLLGSPESGPNTGGSGPISEGGVEIDPTWTYVLSDGPIGAAWFVIDTDTGARVVANVVGGASMASWPSNAGAPALISVLGADHIELWGLTLD